MTQTRLFDFGALLTSGRTKSFASGLLSPGTYTGLTVTTASSTGISLSPGTFLLPSGTLIVEDAGITIAPPSPTSDYALIADHADIAAIGGGPVSYRWVAGLLPRFGAPTPTAVSLLYLRTPDVMGPVTAAMLSIPERPFNGAQLASADLQTSFLQAPFSNACDVLLGPNVTITAASHASGAQFLGWRIANSAIGAPQLAQFRLPLPLSRRVRAVSVYADIPNLGSIALANGTYVLKSADGTTVANSPASIGGPITGLTVPVGTFRMGNYTSQPVSLGVTITVPPLTSVFIRALEVIND